MIGYRCPHCAAPGATDEPAGPPAVCPRCAPPVPVPAEPPPPAPPVRLQTQADIAAALTVALAGRMKPRPRPRRDLHPATALWALLTGGGAALVLLALFADPGYRWGAWAAAGAQVLAGYVWIVYLTARRAPARGWACAVPPLTLGYLVRYKYARLRPLRFVASGAALAAAAAAVPALAPHARGALDRAGGAAVAPPPPVEALSKLEQLRRHRDDRAYEALIKVLELLARTDPLLSADRADRAALAAELAALCDHPLTDVKVRALAAFARWDPERARIVCLGAVRSPSAEEREWALRLLPQWKDAEVARAVQALVGRPGAETARAKAALEEIGGPPAEEAAVALLNRAEDQSTKLTALAILEKVAGPGVAAQLRTYAARTDDPAVRARALAAAAAVEARVRVPAP